MHRYMGIVVALAVAASTASSAASSTAPSAALSGAQAQTRAREQLAKGQALWDQRLANSAIAALEAAAQDPSTAAEAHEALGRLYTFKGWLADNVYPGWHDEPSLRQKALTELRAAVAADPNRASAREALRTAEEYAAADAVDPAPPRPEIRALDQKLQAAGTVDDILSAVEARAGAQADAAPYFTGAQMLIDKGAYAQAIAMANRGAAASDRFITENLSAYQLTGKSQGSFARGRATAADLTGWALFEQKDYAKAREKLEEAARLSQDQDPVNQFHLGELARAQGDAAQARNHYLDALSLSGGPAPLRQRVTQALQSVQAGGAVPAGGFDAWLDAELARRRDERKSSVLKSLVDRPLPKLTLATVDGRSYDTSGLQGKVLLLNFFASW
jgi:tetratricopeptide (TPR) repeat protein